MQWIFFSFSKTLLLYACTAQKGSWCWSKQKTWMNIEKLAKHSNFIFLSIWILSYCFFFFANWHKIIFVHCFISFDFLRYCIYFLSNFFILMEILIKNLKAIWIFEVHLFLFSIQISREIQKNSFDFLFFLLKKFI